MGFVRKYFAWVVIGVALLAEGAAMLFVRGKQGQARDTREKLEHLRQQRDQVQRQVFGIEGRIAIHKKRKDIVRREMGDCALFLWQRGEATEGLFQAKELAGYDAYPWQQPRNFDVFKVEYQGVYNDEVKKLEPLMRKVGADPSTLAFADPGGPAQSHVTIGDIFALQKEFWVKKELVEILAAADAELQGIVYGAGAAAPSRRLPPGKMATGPGDLADKVAILMTFACDYQRVNDVVEALLRSRLCLSIQSITNVMRAKLTERQAGGPGAPKEGAPKAPAPKAPPGAPEGPAAGKAKEKKPEEAAAAGQPERSKLVSVTIAADMYDITMGIQEVHFALGGPDEVEKAPPPGKEKAAADPKAKALRKTIQWLDRQLAGIDKRLKQMQVAGPAKRPEASLPWVARELQKLDKMPPPEPGKAATVSVEDELFGSKRQYLITGTGAVEAAREWLERRCDFEEAKLKAHEELWRRVRALVEAGKFDDKNRIGVVVNPEEGVQVFFRPAAHFAAREPYEIEFDGGVKVKLGHVMFKPLESREGMTRATRTIRP